MTLGHLGVLESLGLIDARDPGELAACVLVCSGDHRSAVHRLSGAWFRLRSWWWGVRLGEWDFAAKRQDWSDYVRYNTEVPRTAPPPGQTVGAGEIPIPAYHVIRAALLSRLNYDPSTVDDTPLLTAQWDRLSLAAINRTIEVLEYTEEQIAENMDAIDFDAIEKASEQAWFGTRKN